MEGSRRRGVTAKIGAAQSEKERRFMMIYYHIILLYSTSIALTDGKFWVPVRGIALFKIPLSRNQGDEGMVQRVSSWIGSGGRGGL